MTRTASVLTHTAHLAAADGSAGGSQTPGWLIPALVAGLVLAIVLAFWGGMRRGKAVRAAQRAELAEHHRVRWEADPDTFRPEPRHWPLAVAAIFGVSTGDPWDRLRHRDVDAVRAGLAESWGIRSRAQLLVQMHWLLVRGHRADFEHEISFWSQASGDVAEQIAGDLGRSAENDEEAAETLWRFRRVRADDRDIRAVNFLAWDLVRFTMLARAGATAGYLSEAEASDTMLLAARHLRTAYPDWAALGEHFLKARWYWASTGGPQAVADDEYDARRHHALLAEGTGPWSRVPWDMSLPEPRLLFVDALLAEELAEPLPADDVLTPLGAWLDTVVRERRGADPATP